MINLLDEVLGLNRSTSDKYVVEPDRKQIQSDLLIGLRRFKNTLRWREFWRIYKQKKRKNMSNPEETNEKETTTDEKENFAVKLRPKHNAPLAPKGTDHLEAFLKTL